MGREQVRGFIQRDHFPAVGNAQFVHKRDEAVKKFRHSSTLSRSIDVKDVQSSQRLSRRGNVCQHIFPNKAFIAI